MIHKMLIFTFDERKDSILSKTAWFMKLDYKQSLHDAAAP